MKDQKDRKVYSPEALSILDVPGWTSHTLYLKRSKKDAMGERPIFYREKPTTRYPDGRPYYLLSELLEFKRNLSR